MLNANINYPYPVLKEYADDYNNTIFFGEFSVQMESDGYLICPAFTIDNNEIKEMLIKGKLTYAIEVQCASTWYRKLFEIKSNESIKLYSREIHNRVDITSCIIAKENIKYFSNEDFVKEYEGLKFELNIGDVVGIGQKRTFDALYQNDIIRNGSSIINIVNDNTLKEISYNFNGSIISIKLPLAQYENYISCGYNKEKYKILNAILVIPVLVEAICIINSDENNQEKTSGFETNLWYTTIVANLKRYAETNNDKYIELLNKPFVAAELLLGNNYVRALKFLSELD